MTSLDPALPTRGAVPEPAPALPPGVPGPHTPPDAVHLTIDGFTVRVPKGTLIIRAAELIGVQIPRFCDHPLLDPVGACRQCLVEVEGQRKPVASCTMPVSEGMVVQTQLTSPQADKAQQGTMELLLINHPLDCPVCDKGGECPLQDISFGWGAGRSRMIEPKRHFKKPIELVIGAVAPSPSAQNDRPRMFSDRSSRTSRSSSDP